MSADDPQVEALPGPVSGLVAWTPCPGCGSHELDILRADDDSSPQRVALVHEITCPVVRQRFQASWPAEQPDLECLLERELTHLALHLSNLALVAVCNGITAEQLEITGLHDRAVALHQMWLQLEGDLSAAVVEDYRKREAAELEQLLRERRAAADHDC